MFLVILEDGFFLAFTPMSAVFAHLNYKLRDSLSFVSKLLSGWKVNAMKKILLLFACLGLLLGLFTCKDKEVDPFSDGKPRILSVSFPSIPAQDVSIDQKNFIIYVKLPATMTVSDLTPTVVVKDSAKVIQLKGFSVPGLLCQRVEGLNADQLEIPLAWRIIAGKETTPLTRYKVKLISGGSLIVVPITQPFTITIGLGTEIDLPFLNLYGNDLPLRIRLTHQATGDTLAAFGYTYLGCSSKVNHLEVAFDHPNLKPGSYRIDVQKADRSYMTFSQPLIVNKGPAELSYEGLVYFGYRVAAGKSFTAEGYNLFDNDIDLYLIDRQDQMLPIPNRNLQFEPNGRKMTVKIPEGTPAGLYVLQLWQHKKPTPVCYRVSIPIDENNPLWLGIIGKDVISCSIKTPALIARQQPVLLTHSEIESANTLLKLTSEANRSLIYYVPVKAYSFSNAVIPPSVTIPISVPAGRYIGSVQVLGSTTGQVLRESEPYGRIIELQ